VLFKRRLIIAICFTIFSGLVVLRSTYAWFVSEDSAVNKFNGTRLSAEIVEEFEPIFQWETGTNIKKVIQVKNTGEVPALVRLSLYEYLLLFEIDSTDQTGNGHLAIAPERIAPEVLQQDPTTWQPAAAAGGTFFNHGEYLIAKQAIIPDIQAGKDRYIWSDEARKKTAFRWFQLRFSTDVYKELPVDKTNYWLYKDGYFYYSERLQPGETSSPVLESVSLSKHTPNKYKAVLYQLNPIMDAHDTSNVLLDAWNIGTNGEIYELYKGFLTD